MYVDSAEYKNSYAIDVHSYEYFQKNRTAEQFEGFGHALINFFNATPTIFVLQNYGPDRIKILFRH